MAERIYVVDADIRVREFLYELISEIGCSVLTLPSGREALERLIKEPASFVFIEDTPGEFSGILLAQRIHRLDPRIKIVLLGPDPRPSLINDQFNDLGIVSYQKKDFSDPQVIRSITVLLGGYDKPAEAVVKSRGRILVVDDEREGQQTVSQFLLRRGFTVVTAASGEEGLDRLRHEAFDAVNLDVMMGGMDGLLTLKRIKESDPKVKVIMATAIQNKETLRQAQAMGVDAYLTKPFALEDLSRALGTALGRDR